VSVVRGVEALTEEHALLGSGTPRCGRSSVRALLVLELPPVVDLHPADAPVLVGDSSITTKVEAGFFPSTRCNTSVMPRMTSAFCSRVAPSRVIRTFT
jgi:hypothetical protein